jgi:hypothetical protein
MQIAWGYAPPLILAAALNCRVFDFLDRGPQTVEELAAHSGASVRGLTAILNALVGLEFLVRKGNRYALTPESAAFLVSTKPAYHGGFFRHMTRQMLPNWLQLTEAVRTGRPVVAANDEGEGQKFFAEFVEGLSASDGQDAQRQRCRRDTVAKSLPRRPARALMSAHGSDSTFRACYHPSPDSSYFARFADGM